MRYGIFSDIHSNLEALETVLEALKKEKVDRYFCVGDIVGYAADPKECINIIRNLNCMTVCGNHDWAASGAYDYSNFNEYATAAIEWTAAKLNESEKDFLKELPLTYEDKDMTLVHGSLEKSEAFNYIIDRPAALRTLDICGTENCFVGHTHSPFVVSKGKKRIANTGSVGQPRDGDPRAAYCIYDLKSNTVEIKRVKYDIKSAMDKILAAGLPKFLAFRLMDGT